MVLPFINIRAGFQVVIFLNYNRKVAVSMDTGHMVTIIPWL